MSFNALSLAKLGVGFGALAVASIGLLSPAPVEAAQPLNQSGMHTRSLILPDPYQRIRADDDATIALLMSMLGEVL